MIRRLSALVAAAQREDLAAEQRLAAWLLQLLVCVDQAAQVLLVGPFYVVGLAGTCPSADETISSYVGRALQRGAWWARPVAAAINGLFELLGAGPDHCLRNVETACAGRAPQA